MSNLIIGGSLLFSEPDCPTREGEVVDTLEDIYNIPSPRVGMRVFVKDTKKSYIVTKLKEEEINGVLVPNAKVDEFEDSQPDVAGMNDAIQANATAIKNEKERAVFEETALGNRIQNVYNDIATLNTTIINYNQRYGIKDPVTKQEVIKGLLDKYTADKGTIVTYYAEDGWHTIQYKLNYYRPEQGKDESNWVEIVNEDAIKDIKDNIDNAYVKPKGGIPKNDLSKEVQEAINNAGEIADGAVTERKLSTDVKNKLNTAYNKATLADSLITNFNKIKPKKGAVEDDGTIYYGTSYCAHIALTGEGKLLLNDGYFIDKVLFLLKDGIVIDIYGENLNITSLEFGDDTLSWLIEFRKSDNTTFNNNDLEKVIKNVSFNSVAWNEYSNLDNYNCTGEYIIRGERKNNDDNMPINNLGDIEARLNVISDTIGKNATQVLTLLNVGGGDGNIYTRTRQDNTWGAWGKLQTNIEVGVINQQQMDALIDNGIYSGILSTTGETFVIICINNYAIAQQVGVHHISQLKYSLVVGTAAVKIEKRTRDAYGFWTDWQGIGGGKSSELLEPSEWVGKLNTLSKGVYEFYGSCTSLSNGSKSVWDWADGYRYDIGDPVYLKMIIGNKPIVQVIGAVGSATKQLNINDETVS